MRRKISHITACISDKSFQWEKEKFQLWYTEKMVFFLSWLTARGSGIGSVCFNTDTLSPASKDVDSRHYTLLPPPKEVMFSLRSVCLPVYLSVCPSDTADNWKVCERILTKFLGGVGHGSGTNEFNFGDDPDHRPDPGVWSPKSGFTRLSIMLAFGGGLLWALLVA